VEEGRWLAEKFVVHAMMDVSDGLGADLPRLARASGCEYRLDEGRVPRNAGCTVGQAISDGEDYELLFALAPREAQRLGKAWRRKFPRVRLTEIGELTADRAVRAPGKKDALLHGYDHFA
jgi:thiamine-monophosphate kinase